MLFIDNLVVPADDLIGEEGKGFDYLLHAFNPERILIAAEAVGIGQDALGRGGALCARAGRLRPADRAEPGHPASRWRGRGPSSRRRGCMTMKAAALYDLGAACGLEANAAKYLAAEAAYRALRECGDDAWRHGLCARVPRRAAVPRGADCAYRAGQPRDDPEFHRREGTWACRSPSSFRQAGVAGVRK
jgi:alkylation response protein AidB-like acyl-CoA dehydrogenase